MSETPNLQLPYIAPAQAQKHVTHNEAIRALDALVHLAVIDRTLTEPPEAPSEGDRHIVADDATGAFSGMEGRIAACQDGAWTFYIPRAGWRAFVLEDETLVVFDGDQWIEPTPSLNPAPFVGINAVADSTNRLSLKSPASLFDHNGAGHQLKINKSASASTASILLQDGFSGRAEFGLTGDDDLHVKISADGANWAEAIIVDKDNGYVGLGAANAATRLHLVQATDARVTIETTNASSGGGFDIKNTTDNQSWRVTGQLDLFKIRDHTAALDKLVLKSGASGDAYVSNIANFGIGTATPSTKLHVNGPARVGSSAKAALPSASTTGAGAILFVTDEAGGAVLAFSDGTSWRRVTDRAVVS